jgi:hypothetical protein
MSFHFDVRLTEQDYLDYNIFWALKSPYGKKQTKQIRWLFAITCVFILALTWLGDGTLTDKIIETVSISIIFILLQLLFNKFYGWLLKGHIKSLKKTGKMGYSPISTIEFFEESLIETTPDNKTETKYSAVERVFIVENKVIYMSINNVMAYILPMASFQSKEEYQNFIGFLTEKGLIINKYEK